MEVGERIERACKYSCNFPDYMALSTADANTHGPRLAAMGYVRYQNDLFRGGHSFQHQNLYAKCNRCEPNLYQLSLQRLQQSAGLTSQQLALAPLRRMNPYKTRNAMPPFSSCRAPRRDRPPLTVQQDAHTPSCRLY